YADPYYTNRFNGHETQQHVAKYLDCIAGQYVFDVTEYFNVNGNNTAFITSGPANYGTILVVVYEAVSEPYRQIWVNEGADCVMIGPPKIGYTMFDNTTTNGLVSAKVTTVMLSGDSGDADNIYFNGQQLYRSGYGVGADPGIYYFNVTSALQNGTNELGTWGDSYLNFAIGVLEVIKDITAPTVIANLTSGVYNTSQTVTLSAIDNMDTSPDIYYTLDGTTPTTMSTLYTGLITIDTNTVLRFFAVDDLGNLSPVQSQTYTIDRIAPVVTANPEGGIFNTSKSVTLTATDNLDTQPDIYYTLDGSVPTTSNMQYTGPITVNMTINLRFFAVDDAGNCASVQAVTYTIDSIAPTVTADWGNGTYDNVQAVNLTGNDNLDTNLDIYYTTDGSTPTVNSTRYTGSITVDRTMTLRFFAVDDAGNTSPVQSRTYGIKSDVYVQVTPSVESPSVGDTVKYTFKLGNNGPGVATDVVFTYQIPEGMEYAGVTVDAGDNRDSNGSLHSGVVNYDPATRTITWTFDKLYKCDPWLYLDMRVINPGTYLIQPTLTTSNYNPGLTSRIGSLQVNAVAKVSSTGTSNVQAATTTSVHAGTVPMQSTGMPLAGFIMGILCVGGGFVLNRRK
ncbi:chitobiase/beta-hexosaminidase C-terminal domain-containing protein, partial [Methanobacterium formicicum]|uniref:chitobiase/beta-hexosaminidase C-terminal domain-containing protein n=1 Tax=Methanobacterium formicicum TaxID=2162 RepID=UPI0024919F7D